MSKSPDAFRTISEVADWLDTPAHVLRFWESKFSQVKPVKRAGGRRYYRPNDMMLLGGIKRLLHQDGHTVKDVQKLLRDKGAKHVSALSIFDLSDDDQFIDAQQVIESEAKPVLIEEPMFTSVAPRKAIEIDDAAQTAQDQMSFPGFEFASDRSKTFATPPPETEATSEDPISTSIDIDHIADLDGEQSLAFLTGPLSNLAHLRLGDLDAHLEDLARVRDQLMGVITHQTIVANS